LFLLFGEYKGSQAWAVPPGRSHVQPEAPEERNKATQQFFCYKGDAPFGANEHKIIQSNATVLKSRKGRNLGRDLRPHIRPTAPEGRNKARQQFFATKMTLHSELTNIKQYNPT